MSFINNKKNKSKITRTVIVSNVGEEVFKVNVLKDLLKKSMGEFFNQNNAYNKTNTTDKYKDLISLIEQVPINDKEYVLKIAEIGRLSGMREYPLNILSACYHLDRYKGNNFIDPITNKNKLNSYSDAIVRRTKDVNHLIALNKVIYNTPLPSQMKKNLKSKIESFDEYKLSKGLDRNKVQSLADTIKMLHPKAKTEELSAFYKDVIENKVSTGTKKKQIQQELNKVKLSEKEDKEVSIGGLIESLYAANLGALLKNLFVYFDYDILKEQKYLDYVISKITDKKTILASKILPYEIYTAYNALSSYPSKYTESLKSALSSALDISIENTEDIKGYSCFVVDVSGSMTFNVTNGTVTILDLAALLAAIALKKGTGDVFAFSSITKKVELNKSDSILTSMKLIKDAIPHRMTDLKIALDEISNFSKKNNITYDNMLLFSDNDCYTFENNNFIIGDFKNFDTKIDTLIDEEVFNSIWINNLSTNAYTIFNTDLGNKNLIMGYNEKFINVMNLYYDLKNSNDTKTLIDMLLEHLRSETKK